MQNPFRYFNSSPEVIRLAVMMYIRYPLSAVAAALSH
jgi:putative transposase